MDSEKFFSLMRVAGFVRVEGQDDHDGDSTIFTLTDDEKRTSVLVVKRQDLEDCSLMGVVDLLLDRHLKAVTNVQ
jgi:hypothetical protein